MDRGNVFGEVNVTISLQWSPATLTHPFLTSKLDYSITCSIALHPETTEKVEFVQNAIAHLLTRVSHQMHITPVSWNCFGSLGGDFMGGIQCIGFYL